MSFSPKTISPERTGRKRLLADYVEPIPAAIS